MARGYAPAIFGFPRHMITQEQLDFPTEREKTRAMEWKIRANGPCLFDDKKLRKGEKVLVYYK